MPEQLKQTLLEQFDFITERPSADYDAFNVPADRLLEVMQYLRDEHGFDMLVDVTAIDHYDCSPRFTGVYHLLSTTRHKYLRLAADAQGDQEPVLPSVVSLFPAADWHERETYDMFGIRYQGHPDLKRILMWEGYPYFPLRKEFPLAGIETELPAADVVERTGQRVEPAPMMGGPFHASQRRHMSEREPRADDESWTEEKKRREGSE